MLAAALVLAVSGLAVPAAEEILSKMAESGAHRPPVSYSGTRTYAMRNLRFNKEARVVVRMTYHPAEGKKFTIVERSGSDILVSIVEKLLDAESEASLPSVAAKTGINRENYTARLRGSDIVNGRECWVLELKPRTRNKFLLAGTLWVDKKSSGIVKVDGKTAASLSMWVGSPHIVEERAEVSGLWLPARTVSQSSTFLAGDSQLEIAYTGYQVHR